MTEYTMNRREFLKHSAAVVGGLAVLTSESRAEERTLCTALDTDERLRIGIIGCGGMGNAHLDTLLRLRQKGYPVEVAAVCDVWTKRLETAAAKTGARPYTDYRRLLEDGDLDAVGIATPDHWHSRITIEAAEAGMDVYCEKPMTHWRNLKEAKQVVETIARTRRVMQVGTQGMSDSIWEQTAKHIRAGAIGRLIHAQASDLRNGPIGVYDPRTNDPDAKPGVNLDWNMWLGPAKKRPWEPGRFFAFRSFWDYSGGIGTDFFPHILTPLIRTMGLTFPRRVTASGGQYQYTGDGREIPDIFTITIEYPDGPSVLLVASLANDTGLPTLIRGHEGTISFEGSGAVIYPQRAVAGDRPPEQIVRTRGASLDEHWLDFLECIRSRQKPRSHEMLGYYVMTALHMGVTSFLKGKVAEFDAQKEQVRWM